MANSEAPEARHGATALAEAMRTHQHGDLVAANRLYREALELDPENPQALRLHGILARDSGDIDMSLELLERACIAAPESTAPLNELAVSQMVAGQFGAAEASLREALRIDPNDTTALMNYGALQQHRGHIGTAIECYEALLLHAPDDIEVQCNLAKALVDAGHAEKALETCARARSGSDDHPFVLTTQGAVLIDLERYTEAQDSLELAIGQRPEDEMAWVNLALCQDARNDLESAYDSLRHAAELNPFNARAVSDLANCLNKLDRAGEALRICEQFLRQYPGECLILASYALALDTAGRSDETSELTDCARLVRKFRITKFAEAAGLTKQSLNDALAAQVSNDPSLLADPVSKSTSGGSQTGELDFDATPELHTLQLFINECVSAAVTDYLADGLTGHPVLAKQAEHWSLRGWGTILDSGGRQSSHMHPLAWLSGVYYVQVPDGMRDESDHAGALQFGIAPDRFRQSARSASHYDPEPGDLVLFPSWFWHQTVPFSAAGQRISIAFDVMPADTLRML